MTFDALRRDIIDEIGVDAYARFDNERYAPEEYIFHILSDVVIVEFLSGFFDFKSLGWAVRERVDAFVKRFWESPQLISLNIREDVDRALNAVVPPDEDARVAAKERLTRFLVQYGMNEEVAKAHALIIEQSILTALPTPAQ